MHLMFVTFRNGSRVGLAWPGQSSPGKTKENILEGYKLCMLHVTQRAVHMSPQHKRLHLCIRDQEPIERKRCMEQSTSHMYLKKWFMGTTVIRSQSQPLDGIRKASPNAGISAFYLIHFFQIDWIFAMTMKWPAEPWGSLRNKIYGARLEPRGLWGNWISSKRGIGSKNSILLHFW